jgi:hypothetical protein
MTGSKLGLLGGEKTRLDVMTQDGKVGTVDSSILVAYGGKIYDTENNFQGKCLVGFNKIVLYSNNKAIIYGIDSKSNKLKMDSFLLNTNPDKQLDIYCIDALIKSYINDYKCYSDAVVSIDFESYCTRYELEPVFVSKDSALLRCYNVEYTQNQEYKTRDTKFYIMKDGVIYVTEPASNSKYKDIFPVDAIDVSGNQYELSTTEKHSKSLRDMFDKLVVTEL